LFMFGSSQEKWFASERQAPGETGAANVASVRDRRRRATELPPFRLPFGAAAVLRSGPARNDVSQRWIASREPAAS
ncbi:MAG: hypothetical protein R3F01_12465, partial [Lysobacteraceae bacterium]